MSLNRIIIILVTFFFIRCASAQINFDSSLSHIDQRINNEDFSNAYWDLKQIDLNHHDINEAISLTFLRKAHCLFRMRRFNWIAKEYWYCLKYLPTSERYRSQLNLFKGYCAYAFLELDSSNRAEQLLTEIDSDFIADNSRSLMFHEVRLRLICNKNAAWKKGKITLTSNLFDSCINEIGILVRRNNIVFAEQLCDDFVYYFFKNWFSGLDRRVYLPAFFFEKCRSSFYMFSDKKNYFDYYVFRDFYEHSVGHGVNDFYDSICSFDKDKLSLNQLTKLNFDQRCSKSYDARFDSIYNKFSRGLDLENEEILFLTTLATTKEFLNAPNRFWQLWKLGIGLLGRIDNANFTTKGNSICGLIQAICLYNSYEYDADCRLINKGDLNDAQVKVLKLVIRLRTHYGIGTMKAIWDCSYLLANKLIRTPNLYRDLNFGNEILDSALFYAYQSLPYKSRLNASNNPSLVLIKEIWILKYKMFLLDSTVEHSTGTDSLIQNQIIQIQYLIHENYKNELIGNIFNICTRYFYEDNSYVDASVNLHIKPTTCVDQLNVVTNYQELEPLYSRYINSSVLNWLFVNQDISVHVLQPIIGPEIKSNQILKKDDKVMLRKMYFGFIDTQILMYHNSDNVNSADRFSDLLWRNNKLKTVVSSLLLFNYDSLRNLMKEDEISIFVHTMRRNQNVQFEIFYFTKNQAGCGVQLTNSFDLSSFFNSRTQLSPYRDTSDYSMMKILHSVTRDYVNVNIFTDDVGGYINYSAIFINKGKNVKNVRVFRNFEQYKSNCKTETKYALFTGSLDYGVASEDHGFDEPRVAFGNNLRWGQKGMKWEYLPHSLNEIINCSKAFKGHSEIISGQNVTTDLISRKIKGKHHYILHFATHGYILDDGNHPFLSSGLALSNANDGSFASLLTFYDILKMDLSGCDLAILSSCNSGRSLFLNRGQSYDLRRALEISGVKYSITTLWEIPDKESALFFTFFYKELSEHKSIDIAFRNTQLEFSKSYDLFYWAAFVLNKLN